MSCKEYRVFLEEFHTNEELLTIKVGPYRLTESEILGEVINWTLQYLSENKCPTKLSAPITRNVVETIQSESRKDPQLCGYDENEKTYDPSKLKNLVILALKTFCQRLLDNVELNKILPELSGNDYVPICITGAIRNKRRYMEDRHICINDFNETYSIPNASKASFYAVFDGHDGYHAAYYTAAQLPYLLASSPLYPLNPPEAMRQSFRGTDLAFVQKTYQQSIRGGTTAVCALYMSDESRLYVGWVGDSKALLVKQGKIMQIVKPHKPEDPKEKKRIHAAGGTVIKWAGMWRVDGVLNLSRAIGDSKCKPYVTGDPDIVGLELDKNEDFLVLACDGLWDFVAEDKVAEIIYDQLNVDSENLNKIPQKLIDKSKQEGSTDNITIVIVFLKDPYKIVKNTCTIEIMEPAFDNCNIGEFNNSEQVLSTNANTMDFTADQSKELFDDHQQQKQNSNSNQLLQQFNDGLNNFLQDPNNICTNMMNLNFEQMSAIDQLNDELIKEIECESKVKDNFTKNTIMTAVNDNVIDELIKGETPTDFEQEICNDVTDDIAMVITENSEHSTISHSKDTLPLSDNFNPFDNKLSFENRDEYNPSDNTGYLHDDNDGNDDAKSTPMMSPDSEEIMNQGSDDMNELISPEYEQPIVEELATGIELFKQPDNSEHKENFENDFIQTNGHLSPEKHIEFEEQDIYKDQEQHLPEAHLETVKEIDNYNEETHQNEILNDNYNKDVVEHHNEIFGLNSIKENNFESNYAEGASDLDYNNQHNLIDEEKQNDFPDDIQILNSDNCNEKTEETIAEEKNILLEENININRCSENDFNPNLIPHDRELLIESEKEQQSEPETDNITDFRDVDTRSMNDEETTEKEQQNEHEIDNITDFTDVETSNIKDEGTIEKQQPIEPGTDNITDFTDIETSNMKADDYLSNNKEKQNASDFDPDMQNTENYPISAEIFNDQKTDIEQHEEQPLQHDTQEEQYQRQNFEDDGFAEQEFAEHDNFDEQHFDQTAVSQNPSVGAEIVNIPAEIISPQQQQERLESCDESEDEWKYMRLKEGEGEKEIIKTDTTLNEIIDNREQSDLNLIESSIVDLTNSSFIKETTIREGDNSITDNIQLNSSEEKIFPTEISLEEPKELSNQQEEKHEILPSSPKPIAINLNNKTPIATDLDDEDDMNYQLNPEAKEFIPLSPPTSTGNAFLEDGDNNNGLILNGSGGGLLLKMPPQQQQHQQPHLIGDDVVAQSPRKGSAMDMDEIYVPDQLEFETEVRHRPHEIIASAQKLADSTVAAIDEIIDNSGNNNGVLQPQLYQELNLKEAMHGSEKEDHILSPTTTTADDIIDGDHHSTDIINPIFNPVAEFENIDMKDSIYIEKSSSHNQQQQQNNDEFETNEDILNRVQLLPDHFDSNKNLSSNEFIRKEDIVSNENEKDIVSPINDIVAAITTTINNTIPVNGLSSQENNENLQNNITNDLNKLKLSSDDTSINEESPNNNKLDIDLNTAEPAAVTIAATTIAAAGVTAAAAIASVTALDDKKIKAKVAEKNLKNKIKSPKVPEKKLSATTTTLNALKKTNSATISSQPKKATATATSSKTSVTSSSNKPKTLTVSTAPAPKTLTFPRPRTAPANINAAAAKNGTSNSAGGITTTTTITKSRIDTSRPATLTVKKPLAPKTTSTIESKTNTIKSNVSKTGISAKSSVTSRTSATTNIMSKPRPASATANGSSGNITTKTTITNQRPTSVKNTAKPPLSPRGTYTSTLRKTEAIKSPTKSTTTITSTTSTSRVKGPTTTTTTSRTLTTAPKTAGTVRKTTLTAGNLTNTTAAAKKVSPIKRPTPIKKDTDKIPTPITGTAVNGTTSSMVVTNTIISTTMESEPPKINGITPSVDLTDA